MCYIVKTGYGLNFENLPKMRLDLQDKILKIKSYLQRNLCKGILIYFVLLSKSLSWKFDIFDE